MMSSKIEAIAKKANAYARKHIVSGATQLETNKLPVHQRVEIYSKVKELRRQVSDESSYSILALEEELIEFFAYIELCKKYALGNCQEMTYMALDYIVKNEPDVEAEAFYIDGGDHVFLVIGRNPDSDANDPLTWGDDAYICDPWANRVYRASDYQTELHDYRGLTEKTVFGNYLLNCPVPLDSDRTELKPIFRANTRYIRLYGEPNIIKSAISLYQLKLNFLKTSINEVLESLLSINKRLLKRYGEEDSKYKVVKGLIETCQQLQAELSHQTEEAEAHKTKPIELEKLIRQQLKDVKSSVNDTHCQKVLSRYHQPHSFSSKVMSFFGIRPTSARRFSSTMEDFSTRIALIKAR